MIVVVQFATEFKEIRDGGMTHVRRQDRLGGVADIDDAALYPSRGYSGMVENFF